MLIATDNKPNFYQTTFQLYRECLEELRTFKIFQTKRILESAINKIYSILEAAMEKAPRILICLIIAFSVAGFSFQFEVYVNHLKNNEISFKFLRKNPLFGTESSVKLNDFFVVEKKNGQWDYKNPLWAFTLEPGSALEVKQVSYGITPSDFSETTKAKPLIPGASYLALASGPGSGGSKEFTIQEP